jgi:hypothetical protein
MSAAIDMSSIVGLTVQINALQQQMNTMPEGPGKQVIGAQISMLSAQLSSEAQHAQAQSDASANLLNGLGLFATLTQTVGNLAPSVIGLFKP